MDIAPIFEKSPLGSTQSKLDVPRWKTVMDDYEAGKYKEAILGLLYYVDPDLPERTGNAEKTHFVVPHGSIVVNINMEADKLLVDAPFLNMPEKGSIPLLRQTAQLNFTPVMLPNIILNDNNQLTFKYEAPLPLCEPFKIYDALREMCVYADKYDDVFITKFKASQIHEPKIEHYQAGELEIIWQRVQDYIKEAQDYIAYFKSKRWDDLVYDILLLLLLKIDYYISPQGYLRTEFEDAIDDLFSDSPYNERVHRGAKFLEKLAAYDKEKLLADIYRVEIFIPYKYHSNIDNIRHNFAHGYNTAKNELSRQDYVGATLTLLKDCYKLFYYNNLDDQLAEFINGTLEQVSAQPWPEAADKLYSTIDIIMDEDKYAKQFPAN